MNRKPAEITPAMIATLPQWTQGLIQQLEIKCERLKKLLDNQTPSLISYGDDQARFIQARTVRFYVEKNSERGIDCRMDDDGILHIYGDGTILINPQASNACQITMDRSYGLKSRR